MVAAVPRRGGKKRKKVATRDENGRACLPTCVPTCVPCCFARSREGMGREMTAAYNKTASRRLVARPQGEKTTAI